MTEPIKSTNLKLKHDGPVTVAIGRSRKETNWKNREMQWSELKERLSRPTRTQETYAEYLKFSKAEKDNQKDVGGYVGGTIKGGRRKLDAVVWRQIITLDADYVIGDLWDMVELVFDYACVLYSTHSHSPEKPRLRLVIPLTRPITPDEYPAVARQLAADLGIDFFDDSTYEVHRLMYWPSTAQDGDFFFHYQDEPWLDPNKVLAKYPDWRDPSYWPESSRAKKERKRLITKVVGNPLKKDGLLGAFCRTYRISEAIAEFLSEVYSPVEGKSDRYTYIAGTTFAGLQILVSDPDIEDDLLAYSHHSSDPVGGKMVNAFDLVRIHKFGDLDENDDSELNGKEQPSFKAMIEFAAADPNVKQAMGERKVHQAKIHQAQEEFQHNPSPTDWLRRLEYSKKGEIEPTLTNFNIILRNDPGLQGIAYNAHRGIPIILQPVPWREIEDNKGPIWGDDDALKSYLDQTYRIFSIPKLYAAITTVSRERSFHPIREYLDALPEWDRTQRVEVLLIDYLGAEDSPYVRAVTKKTLVAAIARVKQPGCKFDCMLVLIGKQGLGKSMLYRRICERWFNDSLQMEDLRDKTGAEKLQGYWIVEIGEMAGMKKVEVEAVKAFLSRQCDIYRPAFGKRTVEFPRQCIVVGGTNKDTGFLRDTTGNRRFWPVNVTGEGKQKPWDLEEYTVSQIWAEAMQLWREGEPLYLSGSLLEEAQEQQKLAMESDERLDQIQNYLDKLLPEEWDARSKDERRAFIQGNEFGGTPEGTVRRDRICLAELCYELFGKDLVQYKQLELNDLHGLMRRVDGWERYTGNNEGKIKFKEYGVQRAYIRISKV